MDHQGYTLKDIVGILFLIIIFALIPLGVYLISKQTVFFSKADVNITPAKVKVTNISENSLTITWLTEGKPASGFVSFGNTPELGNSLFDDRDRDARVSRFTHHVTLKNLDPQTKYYFKIGSSGALFDNNGLPFEAATAPLSNTALPLLKSIGGKAAKQDGSILDEGIVYLTTDDGYAMSAVVRGDNWSIVLSKARTVDLLGYKELEEVSDIKLMLQTGQSGSAIKTVNLNSDPKEFNLSL
ncbi:fibronectin type III domain-containing protein [Candidatus Daviesbacteria bacterium]|nr:fibronectin type III domain-containing protein [Candidatus Daviesbacteria bacterium]